MGSTNNDGNADPAGPSRGRNEERPELTDEQWAALVQVGKAEGRLARAALTRRTLADLLGVQVVAPIAPGTVEITGIGIRLLAEAAQQRRKPPSRDSHERPTDHR